MAAMIILEETRPAGLLSTRLLGRVALPLLAPMGFRHGKLRSAARALRFFFQLQKRVALRRRKRMRGCIPALVGREERGLSATARPAAAQSFYLELRLRR